MSGRPGEGLGAADAGLAVNPNYVPLLMPRAVAENSLGRHEQAKADAERAIRLSPRDPTIGQYHVIVGDAEISLGHFDAAIDAYRKAIDSGLQQFFVYMNLAAAYAHAGKMDEAKTALAEARRLSGAAGTGVITSRGSSLRTAPTPSCRTFWRRSPIVRRRARQAPRSPTTCAIDRDRTSSRSRDPRARRARMIIPAAGGAK